MKLTQNTFKNWHISDDVHIEISPMKLITEKVASDYDKYFAEQCIKLGINPDVLLHQQQEINRLENKLEMALADIPHNCGTCLHAGKKLRDVPCSVCLTDAYRKEWQWKGDADGK